MRNEARFEGGQATWQSNDQRLDDWTRQFFPSHSGPGPFSAQAPTVALAAPSVSSTSDTMSGNVRTLQVTHHAMRRMPFDKHYDADFVMVA